MNIEELRQEIDTIDSELIKLFEKRMKTAKNIADVKKNEGLSLTNKERERKIINNLTNKVSPDLSVYTKILYIGNINHVRM